MDKRIKKIDPTKMIEVSGFRMDSKDTKSIPFVKSEMFLTELMEEICKYNFTIGGADKIFPPPALSPQHVGHLSIVCYATLHNNNVLPPTHR